MNRINIEGNEILKDEALLAELNIQPRRIYTDQLAIEATQKLLAIYRLSGRYAAQIEPQIIRLDNNRVDLVFEVDEGLLSKSQALNSREMRASQTEPCVRLSLAELKDGGPFYHF